jgi:thiamine-monophosphate kinase
MEAELVAWLARHLPRFPDIAVSMGDDAAVFAPRVLEDGSSAAQVVTTDLLCEGVHFVWNEVAPAAVGRKALAVNLSDLAAMAAVPRAAVVALLWPRERPLSLAEEFCRGLLDLAERYNIAIVGGDTNSWTGPLVISVTAMGEVTRHGVLMRDGACPGDAVLVTGQLGGSLAGHHLSFEPRVPEALYLQAHYRLHAGMDISDGLSLDLQRLVEASGVGAELDLSAIPIADAARQLSSLSGKTPLQHALADGEDFELLLTVPHDEAERLLKDQPLTIPITRIGTVIADHGLWYRDAHHQRCPLEVSGYLH